MTPVKLCRLTVAFYAELPEDELQRVYYLARIGTTAEQVVAAFFPLGVVPNMTDCDVVNPDAMEQD